MVDERAILLRFEVLGLRRCFRLLLWCGRLEHIARYVSSGEDRQKAFHIINEAAPQPKRYPGVGCHARLLSHRRRFARGWEQDEGVDRSILEDPVGMHASFALYCLYE